jgi:N-glycosidase YbiA
MTDEQNTVAFYRKAEEPYGAFSNFAGPGFTLDGRAWRSVEHYYQAQKFAGTEYEERIRNVPSPMAAAKMGRSRKYPLRGDWEAVKEGVMRTALEARFTQNPALKRLLLSTGDARIVEASPVDAYWGAGKDGQGKNRLGVLLMELRERLRDGDGTGQGYQATA